MSGAQPPSPGGNGEEHPDAASSDQPPPPGWQQPPSSPAGGWQEGRWSDFSPHPPPQPGGWQQGQWGEFHQPGGWQQGNWPGYPPQNPRYTTLASGPVAHRPGAIPLRPLVLGDLLDGAFRIIRYNPVATIGASLLVSAAAMVIPVVVSLVTGSTGSLRFDPSGDNSNLTNHQVVALIATFGAYLLGIQLQAVGLLYVSGMVAHVTSAAAVGRRLSMSQAWAATAGKRWRLLGMAFLLGLAAVVAFAVTAGVVVLFAFVSGSVGVTILVGIVLGLALLVGLVLYWVRVRALAVPALMLEPVGIGGALGRSVNLSRQQFWRLLGILLVVALIVGLAGSMLRLPFNLAGQAALSGSTDGGYGLTVYVVLAAVGTVLSAAVLQPYQAAVSTLLYVDQRIRKEAYDVELLGRAGILGA